MQLWQKVLWLSMMTLVAAGLFLILTSPGESRGESVFTLMATASVRGEITPCG
jgi:hypothetical protein